MGRMVRNEKINIFLERVERNGKEWQGVEGKTKGWYIPVHP